MDEVSLDPNGFYSPTLDCLVQEVERERERYSLSISEQTVHSVFFSNLISAHGVKGGVWGRRERELINSCHSVNVIVLYSEKIVPPSSFYFNK